MAKKKKEAKIKNSPDEFPVDAIIKDKDEKETDWNVKTVEVTSDTKLEDDKGEGETLTLRFFDFAANPEAFKKHLPTAQELFASHVKQIEVELWKDEWRPAQEVEPRLLLSKDKSHYRIVIAARPARGSFVLDKANTLSEIASKRDSN